MDSHLCQSAEAISSFSKVAFIALRIHPLCSTGVAASTCSVSHKLANKRIHYTTRTRDYSCVTNLSFWPCYWAYAAAYHDLGHIHWAAIFVKNGKNGNDSLSVYVRKYTQCTVHLL